MATHIRLVGGEILSVHADLSEVGTALSTEGRLVALQSSFGGVIYVNPSQVLFLEESPEVGSGREDAVDNAEEPSAPLPSPNQPPSPSQPPPGI